MVKNTSTVRFLQIRDTIETANLICDLCVDVSLPPIQHTACYNASHCCFIQVTIVKHINYANIQYKTALEMSSSFENTTNQDLLSY